MQIISLSQKLGSCYDIAVASYCSTIVYKRPDPLFIEKNIEKISWLVESSWPGLYIEKIDLPKNLFINVSFAGKSASTVDLVSKVNSFKINNKKIHKVICDEIKEIVCEIIEILKNNDLLDENDQERFLILIDKNRDILKKLSDLSGANLETEELRKIYDLVSCYECAIKFSGAGGGDCCIAFSFDESTHNLIKNKFISMGFITL